MHYGPFIYFQIWLMGEYSHIPSDFDNVSNSQVPLFSSQVFLGFRVPIYSDLLFFIEIN